MTDNRSPRHGRCFRSIVGSNRYQLEMLEARQMLAVGEWVGTLSMPSFEATQDSNTGGAIAVGTEFVAVGAPRHSFNGRVAVYQEDGTLVQTLRSPSHRTGFGYAVDVQHDRVLVGSQGSSTVYLFDATTGQILQRFHDPYGEPEGLNRHKFGMAVALDGDRVVIGAFGDDSSGILDGRAYLFDAGTGELVHELRNPTPKAADEFGIAVGVAGDWVAVGARWDDTGAADAGSAYLFDANSGELVHEINNPAPERNDQFGVALDIDGETFVVAARGDDTAAANAGSVYVYDVRPGTLRHSLYKPDAEPNDSFGEAIAVQDDRVLVGALRSNQGAVDAGEAILFSATTGEVLDEIRNPDPGTGEAFAESVALSQDFVFIGARRDRLGRGAAFRFDTTTRDYLELTRLSGSDSGFGRAIDAEEDQLIVGVPFDSRFADRGGVAMLYDLNTLQPTQLFHHPDTRPNEEFGSQVVLQDDFSLIAAPKTRAVDDAVAGTIGSAFLFRNDGSFMRRFDNPEPTDGDCFGCAMALSDQLIVVGAAGDDHGQLDSGSVYVFDRDTGSLLHTLRNPNPAQGDQFGAAVAVAQGRIIVGAPNADVTQDDGTDDGRVYVFDALAGQVLYDLDNDWWLDWNEGFGSSIVAVGSEFAVGTPRALNNLILAGGGFLYEVENGEPRATYTNTAPLSLDGLGESIDMSEDFVLMGGADGEVVFLYERASGQIVFEQRGTNPVEFGAAVALGADRFAATSVANNEVHIYGIGQPVAVDDFAQLFAGASVTIHPVGNDFDPDPGEEPRLGPLGTRIVSATDDLGNEFPLSTSSVRNSGRNEIIFATGSDFDHLVAGRTVTVQIRYEAIDGGSPFVSSQGFIYVTVMGKAVEGDFNLDRIVTADDIDLLTQQIRSGENNMRFDLSGDGRVDADDRAYLLEQVLETIAGDTNLDGIFDSTDLVLALRAGEFEDDQLGNSTWSSGDWNGDGEFDSSDIVAAFRTGRYQA